jgi:hypothetical protein
VGEYRFAGVELFLVCRPCAATARGGCRRVGSFRGGSSRQCRSRDDYPGSKRVILSSQETNNKTGWTERAAWHTGDYDEQNVSELCSSEASIVPATELGRSGSRWTEAVSDMTGTGNRGSPGRKRPPNRTDRTVLDGEMRGYGSPLRRDGSRGARRRSGPTDGGGGHYKHFRSLLKSYADAQIYILKGTSSDSRGAEENP